MTVPLELYVGSYTSDTGGRGAGISRVAVDEGGTRMTVDDVTETPSPSYLLCDRDHRAVFAANETADGSVSSFHRTRSGALEPLGTVPSEGGRPCHLALHPSGRFLAVSNWAGGTYAVLGVRPDGTLTAAVSVIRHDGRGVHPTRQTQPHPHTVSFSPDGRWALLVDGGLDTIDVHAFDDTTGRLTHTPSYSARSGPGSGPRHLVWITRSRFAVVEEITGRLSSFCWSDQGTVTGPCDSVASSLHRSEPEWPSELQMVGGRDLLVANRNQGVLTRFRIGDGGLFPLQDLRLPSPNVRHFWAADGVAYAALQDSDRLVSVDLRTGAILGQTRVGSAAFIAQAPISHRLG
jgi:6-phosphogluconolactonase